MASPRQPCRIRAEDRCEVADLDQSQLTGPSARIPWSQLVQLYDCAARLTKNGLFGLHVGYFGDPNKVWMVNFRVRDLDKMPANRPRHKPSWPNSTPVHVLANELRGRNITVNAVAPGPVGTELFLKGKSEAQIEEFKKLPPLERLGMPEDIANVVSFLAGPNGGWVNSQVLRANGGFA